MEAGYDDAVTALHVEVGDKVRVAGDPMTHAVSWASPRAWDAACGLVLDDYQPDYYECMLADARTYDPRNTPSYRDPKDEDYNAQYPALQLQRAPDDALITCLLCLRALWHLGVDASISVEAEDP